MHVLSSSANSTHAENTLFQMVSMKRVISAYKWAITRVLRPASLCALLKTI